MTTPTPDLFAQSILIKEERKARARAVLNRPPSSSAAAIIVSLLIGLTSYFLSVGRFEAPAWVIVLLIAGFIGSVINAMELWATRRRLEAAIVLLQSQQESDRSA